METVEASFKRKFSAVRAWWRLTRVSAGALLAVSFALLLCLICFHIDRLHPQSAISREIWRGIIFLAGALTLGWFSVKALLKKLADSDLAAQVERRYPVLRERLLTTVSLLPGMSLAGEGAGASGFSRPISAALAEETFREAEPLDFRRAVDLSPLKKAASGFFLALVVFGLHALFAPLALANWFRRMADPRNDVAPWAHTRVWAQPISNLVLRNSSLDVIVTTQGVSVENATLYMKPAGDPRALPQPIPLTNPKTVRATDPESKLPEGVSSEGSIRQFRYRLKAVPENMILYATANDGKSNERTVTVDDRPALLSLRLTYHYPKYMNRPANTTTVSSGSVTAPFGTEVEIGATANKPLKSVEMTLGSRPSGFWSVVKEQAYGRLNVRQDGSYHLNLTDMHGFSGAEPPKYEIISQKDQVPTVQISRPASDIDLQPEGSLPLIAHAKDDYGIVSANLVYESQMETALGGHAESGKGRLTLPGADGKPELNISERWHIGAIHPKVGETISYFVSATDNDTLSGPHVGKSVAFRVHVRSLAEMQKRLMEMMASEQQALGELRKRQIDAQNLLRQARQKPTPQNLQKAQEAQRAVGEEAKSTQQRIADTSAQLENNNLATQSELKRRNEAEEIIKSVAQTKAPAAAETLQKAQPQNPKNAPNSQSLATADKQETEVRNEIEKAQAKLSAAPSPEELSKEIERLSKEQQDRGDASKTLAEDIAGDKRAGKPMSQVSKEALQLEKQHQAELNRDTEKLQNQLKEAAKAERERGNEKVAKALERAAEALKKGQVAQNQQEATKSLDQNNPSKASSPQDKAAAALAKASEITKEATDPNSGETPTQTAERLEKAAEELKNLAKQEKNLAKRAGENPDKEMSKALAEEQKNLEKQTQQAAKSLSGSNKAQQSAQSARQNQSKSAQQLSQGSPSSAKSPAEKAAEQLEKAASEAQREAERIRQQEQAAELAEKIEQLAQVQRGVLNTTARLQKTTEKGELNANDERELGQTGERQKGLESQANALAESIPSAAFKQALALASKQMHPATQNLNQRKPNTGQITQSAQTRAYETLETIAQALKQQAQSGGAGGSSGSGGAGGQQQQQQQQEASALAELMLAKGLQDQLKANTSALDKQRQKNTNKELNPGQKQEAANLAEGQNEARDIAKTAGEDLSAVQGAQEMIQKASEHIEKAGQGLAKEQTGSPTQQQQEEASNGLEQAIKTTQEAMKQQQQQQSGQGQAKGMPKPVPGQGQGKGKGNDPDKNSFTKLVSPEKGPLNGGSAQQPGKGFGPMSGKQQRTLRDGRNDPVPAEYRDLVKRYFGEKKK